VNRPHPGWHLLVVVALAASLFIACSTPGADAGVATDPQAPPSALSGSTGTPDPTAQPSPASTAVPSSELAFGPTGPTQTATVLRVTDGDTIKVDIGGTAYSVRYIGMDTPETKHPSRPVEWMGVEASAANASLVDGKTVVLEKDVSETDRYGRLLRYVWLPDGAAWILVNVELVRAGFASISTYPPDVKYVELIREAEQAARDSGVGLWGAGPVPTPDSTLDLEPDDSAEPETEPKSLAVKIVNMTSEVRAGATATIDVKTAAGARCSITVEYKSGPSEAKGLGSKKAKSDGRVAWSWLVGSRTTSGRWPIAIRCSKGDRDGQLSTRFQVR